MKLGQLIGEQFHLKTTVPQWREKKVLFGGIESEAPGEEVKEELLPEEPFSVLLNHLDRIYKRLRRKLKRGKKRGEEVPDPGWLKQLGEVSKRLEELEKELE